MFTDPINDPERRWAQMRALEKQGQLRLPLDGVPDPTDEEHAEAERILRRNK